MRQLIKLSLSLILLATISAPGHAADSLAKVSLQNKGKSIAVVSVSANNYMDSLQGWNSANTSDLMGAQLNKMLELTENMLAKDWKVIKAETFATKDEFQVLAGEQREVGLPYFGGHTMPLFSKNRKQLIKTEVDKETAVKLAQVTGADFILIAYSEWAVATGKFVPTSKSLAKNVVGIYNASGKQVYFGRADTIGDKTLGGLGNVVVDKNTISEWVVAYEKGLNKLYGIAK